MNRIGLILVLMISLIHFSKAQSSTKDFDVQKNVDTKAEFPGGKEALKDFIFKNVIYPDCAYFKALNVELFLEFLITKDGFVVDKTDYKDLDGCEISAILPLIELMPKWNPAIKDGLLVDSKVSFDFIFQIVSEKPKDIVNIDADYIFYIFGTIGKYLNRPKITDTTGIFTVVEVNPIFPGGMDSLFSYLANSIVYPLEAQKKNISGRVILRFVVDENGMISNIRIIKDIGEGCGEEAYRVVSEMPRWTPGYQKGKPVKVYYTLPIKFTLE